MLSIPLSATPSQSVTTNLGGQQCLITLRTMATGLFLDLSIAGQEVVSAVLCLDRVRLIRYGHLGFAGNLAFYDTQGRADPEYAGLGTRFLLVYLELGE